MTSPETGTDGLDDLRRDLARLVLDEAGRAVAREPGLPLSTAMVEAVGRQASEAAERERQRTPDAEALSASVLATLRPELIRIVQAASSGDARGLATSGGGRMPGALGIGLAVSAAILLFVAGFVTAKLTTPVPEPASAAWPVVTEPVVNPATQDGLTAPADDATTAVQTPPQAQSPSQARAQTPARSGPATTSATRPQRLDTTPGAPVTTPTTTAVTETPPA